MKFTPLQVQAHCARARQSWTVGFGYRDTGLSLFLTRADDDADDPHGQLVAEINAPRQIDAIIELISDIEAPAQEVSMALFDLLITLAMDAPEQHCRQYLLASMTEWVTRNRCSRMIGHYAA